jgi:hypothetical protein
LNFACLFPLAVSFLICLFWQRRRARFPRYSAYLFATHLSRFEIKGPWEEKSTILGAGVNFSSIRQKVGRNSIALHRIALEAFFHPPQMFFSFVIISSPHHEPKVFPEKDCLFWKRGGREGNEREVLTCFIKQHIS